MCGAQKVAVGGREKILRLEGLDLVQAAIGVSRTPIGDWDFSSVVTSSGDD